MESDTGKKGYMAWKEIPEAFPENWLRVRNSSSSAMVKLEWNDESEDETDK